MTPRLTLAGLMRLVAFSAGATGLVRHPTLLAPILLFIDSVYLMGWAFWLFCNWPDCRPHSLTGVLGNLLGIAAMISTLGIFATVVTRPLGSSGLDLAAFPPERPIDLLLVHLPLALLALWITSWFVGAGWNPARTRRSQTLPKVD